jgi:multiple antibiotic resistance protein
VLFLIMDPVGNLPSYLSLVKGLPPKKQYLVIVREMCIALLIMLGFTYLGEYIFRFLDLSEITVHLSSGIILFLIAVKILFPAEDSLRAHLTQGEPFIFPLAVPLIAGPALLATLMLYAHSEPYPTMLLGILIAWSLSMLVLFLAHPIQRLLGNNGLLACERLIGMILVLIAVQRFLEGVLLFLTTKSPLTAAS